GQGARAAGFWNSDRRQARFHHRGAEFVRAARNAGFALLVGLTLPVCWAPLSMLVRFSFQQEHYSHIILIPLVSASLLFLEGKRIFAHVETRWGAGLGLLVAGVRSTGSGRDTPPP